MQVSQYNFAMCSYREKKADPTELLQLDGFTVDYTEPDNGSYKTMGDDVHEWCLFICLDLYGQGGKYFFTAFKEGDEVKFATDDENERHLWVQALYRATGQSYKPVPPKQSSMVPSKAQGGHPHILSHTPLNPFYYTQLLFFRCGQSQETWNGWIHSSRSGQVQSRSIVGQTTNTHFGIPTSRDDMFPGEWGMTS